MEPVIEAKHLSKIYGKGATAFLALSDINLKINHGESVAIVGKSGSGKSTLMHCLALLDTPTSGELKIDGEKASKLKSRKLNRLRNRRFGFVFQQFFMNSNETVLENVLLPLKISGTRRKHRKRLALEAIETVELADKARVKSKNLSGGQKQRVCIARAIVNNPKILFADEPTGNLDSATGEKIIKLLFDLNHDKGVTLIIVTHDEDLAALCDRRIRITDGKIVVDESIKHVTRPAARAINSKTKPANTPEAKKAKKNQKKGVRK
ncbi:ABC transporter ATP-binding protein [Candidatus Saccharibacteria bacterium]|nr:ABC transporter ATP-binding protein [Candidatus Saccharibacteria bacterium]